MASIRINKGEKILLFLANPFVSAVTSLRDIRDGFSHRLLYCWFIVFGIGFCAFNESADSSRYVELFNLEGNYTWNQYVSEVEYWLTFEGDRKDIYTLTVNYLVGQFTNNYHWTFFIYAIVFGFFYIRSLRIFLKYTKRNDFVFYALLFLFCYSNPIFNINGVRFYTSAWIGVFVALNLFVENKPRYLPLLGLMPIIHGSSVIWVGIMLIAWLTKYYQRVWIVLFVASSFVSAVSYLSILDNYSSFLPQFMQNQIWDYTESDVAIARMEGHSQYGKAYADFLMALPGYFTLLLSYLLIFKRKQINAIKEGEYLFTVFLALSAITNFLSSIPSVGRFRALVIPFLVIIWILNSDIMKKYMFLFYFVPVLYAYSILYWVRHMLSVTEKWLYLFPAPFTIIKYLI